MRFVSVAYNCLPSFCSSSFKCFELSTPQDPVCWALLLLTESRRRTCFINGPALKANATHSLGRLLERCVTGFATRSQENRRAFLCSDDASSFLSLQHWFWPAVIPSVPPPPCESSLLLIGLPNRWSSRNNSTRR